jgi:hypothetical protein
MALLDLRNLAVRLAVVALAVTAVRANAQESVTGEYQVKAAFLYNFTKFVEWPPGLFESSDSPISICVLGQNLFGHVLQETVRGKTVNGRMLVVSGIPDARSATHCQIVFVSSFERMRFGAILGELRSGILTVGETDAFIEAGGIVNLKLESGRIQIQVNINAAEQAGVHISSKLLSLAQIIRNSVPPK